ncbi:MAG: ATP-dependent RecD-like DNA helicase [Parachlamydiaceae bacterium]|nr:ATP-dependent RecD-like DNA helicase [Parachlamydiaceae bacterium]
MEEIVGYIERLTFQNAESGFTIAQLQESRKQDLSCIVGTMPSVSPGETLRCYGSWKRHLVHGMQFEVARYQSEVPASVEGIKKYLGSGLIKGIGTKFAARIVDKFGTETLEVIEKNPQKLLEIPGLGKKKLQQIISCWSDQRSIRDVMIFLQSNGVSPAYAQKIYKIYGDKSIEKVQGNPYQLARDIRGIGFKTADTIAQTMGIAKESTQRIEAGIEYVLTELAGDGHVCYPHTDFLKVAEGILETTPNSIAACVKSLEQDSRIEVMDLVHAGEITPFLWSKHLFAAEIGIARELKRLKEASCSLRQVNIPKALEWVEKRLQIELAKHQKDAVSQALEAKLQIITGGPGTGKSTITNAIMAITEQLTSKIVLAAPTGRAAKRMTEITGRKALTIHSLLEFDFSNYGFKRKRDNPIECDLIIVDESSMIDTSLMWSLLKAIPDHARLILVGDINQLPSVGPGNVLKDIISSKCLPVTTLTEIFRQAAGSRIILNAHRINRGDFPDIRNMSDSDFYFIDAQTPEEVLTHIVTLVSQRLPLKYKFNPMDDIQVLAPMKKGLIGTENLNLALQSALNPNQEALVRWGTRFQVNDKVMQLRNNYKKNVFNGDIGRIREIDLGEQTMTVAFDEELVEYEFDQLDELSLAYAVSIHKYQGSERACVVIPVHTTHFKLLHRNLLYTAVTRGKKMVVLVGMTKALYIAVKNDEVKKRHSGLQQAVSGIINPPLLR